MVEKILLNIQEILNTEQINKALLVFIGTYSLIKHNFFFLELVFSI